jgi:hypothetical protein
VFAGSDKKPKPPRAGLPTPAQFHAIERDVERLRGHRFKKPIEPKIVTSDEARADALRDVEKTYPEKRRLADEELLKLLGLIPRDSNILALLEKVSGEQVVGYYDTRRKTLRIVSGNGADSPALLDITLAHELVHALEDQVFGLSEQTGSTDDASSAMTAVNEGTATYVMSQFAQCCLRRGSLLTESLGSLAGGGGSTGLPPYIERSLLFSYQAGEKFVRHLHDAADGWKLVDAAIEARPPVSTEQIIHPEKYAPFEAPLAVKVRAAPLLRGGWQRTARGTLGEFDTRELLRLGDEARSAGAAAGWGGGRYELWQQGDAAPAGCRAPCRRRDALLLAWRWDTARDAREFAPVLREYVVKGLKGRAARDGAWGLDGGAVAMAPGRNATTLAFAPTADLARGLARRAAVRAP